MKKDMLFYSKLRKERLVAIGLIACCVLFISWTLLPHTIWTLSSFKTKQTCACNDRPTPQVPSLPSVYTQTALDSTDCAERLGTPFIQDASNTSVSYCNDTSSSTLNCFRTRPSTERVDTFCIGAPALFDPVEMKFKLDCKPRDLTEQQVAAGIPAFTDFPSYWYETGPRTIFANHVNLAAEGNFPSTGVALPKNYTILVRREGPSPVNNLFHHLMQIFSIFITLDILQMAFDPRTGKPYFRAEDVENTRVIVFDDHEEGPFYDQWRAFAKRPTTRIQDLQSNPTEGSESIIVPLPGSANIFWQNDWVPNHCEESKLLQVFSQRMLNFYNISDDPGPLDRQLVLTFIDRTEKRSLINKKAYVDHLKFSYPNIEINLVNFASLAFAEQLKVIRNTDILAGVHGAGLTHGIFLRPSSTIVEILPPKFNHKGFRNIAKVLGHRYFTTHAIEHANYTTPNGWQTDDVFIEQDRLNDLMDAAIKSMYQRGLRNDDVN